MPNFLIKTYPKALELFSILTNNKVQITIVIDPNMPKGSMKYNHSTHTLTFLEAQYGNSYGALEDWAHVVQCEVYYKTDIPSNRNLEFEAKMFCDFNCAINDNEACASLYEGLSHDDDLIVTYCELKEYIADGGKFTSDILSTYYSLGRAWNDSNYQSGTFQEKQPELLINLFK